MRRKRHEHQMLKVPWKGGNIFEMNSMNTWKKQNIQREIFMQLLPPQKNGDYKYNYIS
jgi:hypothetical protein